MDLVRGLEEHPADPVDRWVQPLAVLDTYVLSFVGPLNQRPVLLQDRVEHRQVGDAHLVTVPDEVGLAVDPDECPFFALELK